MKSLIGPRRGPCVLTVFWLIAASTWAHEATREWDAVTLLEEADSGATALLDSAPSHGEEKAKSLARDLRKEEKNAALRVESISLSIEGIGKEKAQVEARRENAKKVVEGVEAKRDAFRERAKTLYTRMDPTYKRTLANQWGRLRKKMNAEVQQDTRE